jgi:hypothetical protein
MVPTRQNALTCPRCSALNIPFYDDAVPHGPTSAPFDAALSALIDHLLVIEDHQLAIEDHQAAIAAACSTVRSLVEELLL